MALNSLSLWERGRVREDLEGDNTFMIFCNQVNSYQFFKRRRRARS